ncbi:hypothetical protein QT869_12745 [Xanthomonas citri pv. citri]|nr:MULTISPECIES: hypothetical protein [Xanthomonas]MBD4615980.1 hypothetical protein [Xanthomonas citri pv. citri]MBD4988195.1 hypothetical protein [Xanthomonas citri pv. citri]
MKTEFPFNLVHCRCSGQIALSTMGRSAFSRSRPGQHRHGPIARSVAV